METIRQCAREKLLDAPGGEAAEARNRHLEFFLDLTEAAEPQLMGAEMMAALDRLEIEQDNLRAALECAVDPTHGHPLAVLKLVAVLHILRGRRTSVTEGRRWVQTMLARAESAPDAAQPAYLAARARALVGVAPEIIRAVQQFIGQSPWKLAPLIQQQAALVAGWLGQPDGVVIVDGSGFPKRGDHSAGVDWQFCGRLGKVYNCQEGVFAVYASARGQAFLTGQLYLPEDWFDRAHTKR